MHYTEWITTPGLTDDLDPSILQFLTLAAPLVGIPLSLALLRGFRYWLCNSIDQFHPRKPMLSDNFYRDVYDPVCCGFKNLSHLP